MFKSRIEHLKSLIVSNEGSLKSYRSMLKTNKRNGGDTFYYQDAVNKIEKKVKDLKEELVKLEKLQSKL